MPLPPGLLNWFKATYPTLTLDPEWLEACVDYLVHNPGTPSQKLIKLVENQLLLSDLSTSTSGPSLLPRPPWPKRTITLWPQKKQSVLVQVTSIDEVAHPALGMLETLKEKRAAVAAGLVPGEKREEEVEGLDGPKERFYPRGMSRLRLEDGRGSVVEAVEMKKVEGLGLEDCKLGCKLLIHNVRLSTRGLLLLEPQSVVVKGHQVEEFLDDADEKLERNWRVRLGMDPNPPPPAPRPARRQDQQPQPQQAEDDFEIDQDELDALNDMEAAAAAPPPPPAPRPKPRPPPPPPAAQVNAKGQSRVLPPPPPPPLDEFDAMMDDSFDIDDDSLVFIDPPPPPQATSSKKQLKAPVPQQPKKRLKTEVQQVDVLELGDSDDDDEEEWRRKPAPPPKRGRAKGSEEVIIVD